MLGFKMSTKGDMKVYDIFYIACTYVGVFCPRFCAQIFSIIKIFSFIHFEDYLYIIFGLTSERIQKHPSRFSLNVNRFKSDT